MNFLKGLLLCVAFSAGAVAAVEIADAASVLLQRYPQGSIGSLTQADRALTDLAAAREQIEARRLADERLCYPQFFTTACLERVREQRREALASIRSAEVEAHTYQRQARVMERDRDLEQRRAEDERDAQRRAGAVAKKAAQDSLAQSRAPSDAEVIAEQQKRAENVLAYERKQKALAQRQREQEEKNAARPAKN